MTRFGAIQIAHRHPYSQSANGFTISPLLQDHLLVLAQQLPYSQAHELAQRLLGPTVSRSTLYRLTMHYGEGIEPALQEAPSRPSDTEPAVMYALADGLMLLFDEGYKETKLGRIFTADALQASPIIDRGGHINASDYVAKVGSWADFWAVWQGHLSAVASAGNELVFISDGVLWLHEQLKASYPKAVMILDIYHVMEHLGEAARAGIGSVRRRESWLSESYTLLIESRLDELIGRLKGLSLPVALGRRLEGYLVANRSRMDYKTYLSRGLCIGSGAIESANKSVVQARLKRSGQRWTKVGAQRVLNLRTCWMSGRWSLVGQHIETPTYAMAA